MLLSIRTQNQIKNAFSETPLGSNYSFTNVSAPQGQNKYSTNFIVQDAHNIKHLLKVLLLEKIPQPNRPQVQDEIDICKGVVSPYVVKLIDHAKKDQYVFLLFPFIEGKNLEDYVVEQGTLPETKVKEIGIGILRGIADINRTSNGNIIHQDLKPENVMISATNEILLLDFGAARYKQSPFRGNARHNFAYSSREQIRASRPSSLEELRITLSDKADVFGTGLILYRLLKGEHPHQNIDGKLPADAILESRPIPQLGEDISVGMKKIIGRMLEYEPLNRLNALDALAALERGDIQKPTLEKSRFFYCATSATGRFLGFKNKNSKLFDGLVLEATQLPKDQKQVAELHTDIKTLIIDPQTYVFQRPPDFLGKTAKKKFENFSYNSSRALLENPTDLIAKSASKDPEVKTFIENVFQMQLDNGADVLIAPYFYIPEFNDNYWTADQEITKLAAEVYETLHVSKPLIKAVAISEEILQSEDSRNSILEYLQSLYDYNGFYVLLDSSHKETIINESWLKSAKELFTHLLATQKFVIWSRAEIFGLALAASGLNIATGEFQKQKKFNINEPPQEFGRRPKYFYLPEMFARIKWPEGFNALELYAERAQFICVNSCCAGASFTTPTRREEDDLAFHTMTALRKQFDKYIGREGNRLLGEDIKKAKDHYDEIRGHRSIIVRAALSTDIKPSSNSFLTRWINALGIR